MNVRRLKFWGWGYADEALDPDEVARVVARVTERYSQLYEELYRDRISRSRDG